MIQHNLSPWLFVIKNQRKINSITKNHDTDICIIGGGISGVITSYFILKNTKYNVHLLEANIIGSGATGRNAGQLSIYFELSLIKLIEKFGKEKAIKGLLDIESTWILLKKIIKEQALKLK